MHIVGIPVKDGYKNGMRKQVAKSQIFTKTSLSKLQDKMRVNCIKSFNKYYEVDYKLKEKELYAALGWLGREDKITIQDNPEDEKELLVSLVQDK